MSLSANPITREKGFTNTATRKNPLAVFHNLDIPMLLGVLAMTALGLITLHGAVGSIPRLAALADKQIVFFWIALSAMLVAFLVDYRWVNRLAVLVYILNIGGLIAVLLIGSRINGAKSWINFGPVSWQPSETMKIATVLVCAQWLALHLDKLNTWRGLLIPAIIVGIPVGLTLMQPDLGTAMVFIGMFFAMCFAAGASRKKLFTLIGLGLGMAAAAVPFLKPYQIARLLVFINPEHDPLGSSYNVIQSRIAIGSGGLTGNGFGEGTQGSHRFLPEHFTDFIFASYIEQFGLIGGALLLLGFFFLILRMLNIMDAAKDRFGGIVVAGFIALITVHIIENIGMNMGLLPVTGIPLPLFSYGGSFLVSTYIMFGIVLNVGSRRYTFT